jgi:hypothetical protein
MVTPKVHMQAVFIGGPRHREEQILFNAATMSLGEYDRVSALEKRDYEDDSIAYFVHRGMNREAASVAIGKHLRDEPDPTPTA